VELRTKALGPDHPDVARSVNNLGNAYRGLDELARARDVHARNLALRERIFGPDHPDVGQSAYNLGMSLMGMGEYAAAKPAFERALAIREKALGPEHPATSVSLNDLGDLLVRMGDPAAAVPLLERSVAAKEKALGKDDPDVCAPLADLGRALIRLGRLDEAEARIQRALAILDKAKASEGDVRRDTFFVLGELHLARRAPAEAVLVLERALSATPAPPPSLQLTLAEALWQAGKDRSRALSLAAQARDRFQKRGDAQSLAGANRWLADHRP
jgi:serine/threonine-protein kinase